MIQRAYNVLSFLTVCWVVLGFFGGIYEAFAGDALYWLNPVLAFFLNLTLTWLFTLSLLVVLATINYVVYGNFSPFFKHIPKEQRPE